MGDKKLTEGFEISHFDNDLLYYMIESMPEALVVINTDMKIVYVNKCFENLLGQPREIILGRNTSLTNPGSPTKKTIEDGIVVTGPRHLKCLNIDVEGTSFPLMQKGEVVGAVVMINPEMEEFKTRLEQANTVAEYLKDQLNHENKIPEPIKKLFGYNMRNNEIMALASKVAKTDSTLLIRGESGVGKEVVAQAIVHSSERADKPFIAINCAALPENLLESELFGFEEGSFTGARKGGQKGKFELANNGTLFLDEVGDMSLAMQAKVLRALQEKTIERIGGKKSIQVDVRVIAATNKMLEKMVEEGTFRQDLYYRLNVVPIFLLPLRERKEDILQICDTLLAKMNRKDLEMTSEAKSVLMQYDWPGNIRELQNVLEYAAILCDGKRIQKGDLPARLIADSQNGNINEPSLLQDYLLQGDFKTVVSSVEKNLILQTLASCNNNRSQAMKVLGLSRRTFYNKLKQYQIDCFSEDDDVSQI